ncbi:MAG TPA: efflux RND transporter periplasmic adaptor subunit [Planctomycetota bacterium]|nr:efflux RND transporter periplasmic adaptor subunit [Planctomycetota bacterium]
MKANESAVLEKPLDTPVLASRSARNITPGATAGLSRNANAHAPESIDTRDAARRPHFAWVLFGLVVVGAVFGVLFLSGWRPMERRQSALLVNAEAVKNATPRVAVVSPKRLSTENELLLPSDVQAVRETDLYARTSGYLKRWLVDMGDKVKEGQLLAEIESPEVDMQLMQAKAALDQSKAVLEQSKAALEQSKAQVGTAKATEELAEITMKRYVGLRGTNSVNEEMISEKEADFKANHARTLAAQAAVAAADKLVGVSAANIEMAQAAVNRLDVLKSFEKVTAPFDGIITARQTENGALVNAGSGTGATPLFSISATDIVRVYVDVPQTVAPSIKEGQTVELLVREFPGKKYSGKVTRTTRSIDRASRTMRTEVQVANANGDLLKGMYTQVKLSVARAHAPVLLPSSALVVNASGTQVAVVRDGKVHFQPVELDGDYGANFGVSSGLTESDSVIANPGERLAEGMAVTVSQPSE